jgi:DDE superfamily endonuclease
MHRGAGGPAFFPPLQRVAIARVACTAPQAYGVQVARWDCRTLQQVVIEQALVDAIHYTTVARMLAEASLQPHRSRYWKTARLDEEFLRLAAKVLWCYEMVDWLHRRGEVVICMDEKPNIQALRRVAPTQPMAAGRIERREFEYERKGVVHFLVAFNVYDGTMLGWCLDKNDHEHFLWGVRQVARRYAKARRIHLIVDNGGSHIAEETRHYFARRPRLRVLYTPAHASWLNQAELLLRAFTAKSLDRFDPESRQQLIEHLTLSVPDYNHRFAHPFEWSWTRRELYAWAEKKGHTLRATTAAQVPSASVGAISSPIAFASTARSPILCVQ